MTYMQFRNPDFTVPSIQYILYTHTVLYNASQAALSSRPSQSQFTTMASVQFTCPGLQFRPTQCSSHVQAYSLGLHSVVHMFRPTAQAYIVQFTCPGLQFRPTQCSSHVQAYSLGLHSAAHMSRPTVQAYIVQFTCSGLQYRPPQCNSHGQACSLGLHSAVHMSRPIIQAIVFGIILSRPTRAYRCNLL